MSNKRRCRFCRNYDIPRDAPKSQITCKPECAIGLVLRDREKKAEQARKALNRQHREEKRKFLERKKPHQESLTQAVVNKLAKMLDKGRECISCGEYRDNMEAGHYRSVGSMPSLRFDPRNIHLQCRSCNQGGTMSYKRGRKPAVVSAEYKVRLRERYGEAFVAWLDGPHEILNLDCDTLIDIRRMFAAEIRFIEKHGRPSRDWRALPAKSELAVMEA